MNGAETQTFERDSSRFRGESEKAGRKTLNERNFARDSVTLSLFHLAFFSSRYKCKRRILSRATDGRAPLRAIVARKVSFLRCFYLITYIAMPPNGSFTALWCLRFHFGGNMLMECPEIIHVSSFRVTRGNQQRERPLRAGKVQ